MPIEGHEDAHHHAHSHDHPRRERRDLNLRAAYVHVLADAATSVLAIGALLAGKLSISGPTVLVVSGRNIDMALHRKIVSGAWEETSCPA